MTVRIETYDQRSGKGTYRDEAGNIIPFRYMAFHEQTMIPPGQYADLKDGILHPAAASWPVRLWRRLTWR